MAASGTGAPNSRIVRWIDFRLPFVKTIQHELHDYPTPRNLTYWWNFGSLAGFMLVIMIVTGIFLAMHYTPNSLMAFNSVERIMRDVNYGWLLRYLHMNGASMFFIIVYIHIFRGLYYGSYKYPRELLWILGVVILLLMMATAFMGYVLPWGQMSYWGATVITNLFSAIPVFGQKIVTLLWGGPSIGNPTLNRFFSLHYLLPFVIVAVVGLHMIALHTHGSNNPLGIDHKGPGDSIPFHPYYTIKDMFGLGVFLLFYAAIVFYAPNALGDPQNYIPANPLQTPPDIVPEWYFLPFYAILRSVPNKLFGVILLFSSILLLFVLPWLDTSPVRSAKFRPIYKWVFWLLVIAVAALGWVGAHPPEGIYVTVGRIGTIYYFCHFLIIFPLLGKLERPKPLPLSIGASVLGRGGVAAGGPDMAKALFAAAAGLALARGAAGIALAQEEEAPVPPHQEWSFQGAFGTFDRAALQRGFQVYKEVCSACHPVTHLAFRDLEEIGYTADQVKGIAAQYQVTDGPNDQGQMYQRPGRPSDPIPQPFPNDQAARTANNGALPPDLSLITKARERGPDYVYAILNGFTTAPGDFKLGEGMFYNAIFPGHQIKMPPPLTADDQVKYADGTKGTIPQMAHDVVTFLSWAAEPTLEQRHRVGFKVILFLVVTVGVLYAAKRKIWAALH